MACTVLMPRCEITHSLCYDNDVNNTENVYASVSLSPHYMKSIIVTSGDNESSLTTCTNKPGVCCRLPRRSTRAQPSTAGVADRGVTTAGNWL